MASHPHRSPSPTSRRAVALAAPLVVGPGAQHHWRIVSLLLLVAVIALAVLPQPPTALSTGWDKANHALAFCALGFAWRLAFPGGLGRWVAVALALLAFGGAIEVAQAFVPGRASDGADLVADALGGAVGLSLVAVLERVLRPRHPAAA